MVSAVWRQLGSRSAGEICRARLESRSVGWYIRWRIYLEMGMTIARVFKSGNSQAVRLPKAFRLKSKEVEIFRRGDEIVLREKKKRSLAEAFDIIAAMPLDMFEDI